jgi:hypothetical protein
MLRHSSAWIDDWKLSVGSALDKPPTNRLIAASVAQMLDIGCFITFSLLPSRGLPVRRVGSMPSPRLGDIRRSRGADLAPVNPRMSSGKASREAASLPCSLHHEKTKYRRIGKSHSGRYERPHRSCSGFSKRKSKGMGLRTASRW